MRGTSDAKRLVDSRLGLNQMAFHGHVALEAQAIPGASLFNRHTFAYPHPNRATIGVVEITPHGRGIKGEKDMFEAISPAPPDPIMGLTEAFKADPRPGKINLGVGVYKDASGNTPILDCVKVAEQRILETQKTKSYKPIDGDPAYAKVVQNLMFGADHPLLASGRVVTAHTVSGTVALRVAGDFLHRLQPETTLWMPDPTWPNHPKIFMSAEVSTKTYPYSNTNATGLDIDAMIDGLRKIPAGDVVLLHGCCQNPTGIDPSPDQWKDIAVAVHEGGAVPLLDFAYQGLANGIKEDAAGLHALATACDELIVCTSFSKNMALYNERVGSVSFVTKSAEIADAVRSQLKVTIRTNYSNPAAHGGNIVINVLGNPELREMWLDELAVMRNRINNMRQLFADTMRAKGVSRDFSYLTRQRGMFSFSGLNKEQVQALREDHAIYIVGSGRVNVAGMTEANMDQLCTAIASVM